MCVLQVILAYESIVLCMCSGNVLNGYYMLSLAPYEHVRSVSLTIHLVRRVSVSLGVFGHSETIRNSPAGTKILIFAVKYDMTLIQ